jgi:hypothetical protein
MARKTYKKARRTDPVELEFEADNGDMILIRCVDDIPGGVIFDFSGDSKDQIGSAKNLFDKAIIPADRALFWSMMNADDGAPGVITASQMMEMAEDLAEEYTARPTGVPSGTGSPKTSNGSPSTGGASNEVSTYSRSEPTALTT